MRFNSLKRPKLLHPMNPESSFYMCVKFQSKVQTQFKDIYQLSVILTDPRTYTPDCFSA